VLCAVLTLPSAVLVCVPGDNPYCNFSLGLSMDPFMKFLEDGNRLPRPDGLSDSL